MKNNKNKAKLIINNKKNILKELVDIKEFASDKIKIKLIFNKGITNISHMFENCSKLIELSIYDNKININDEEQEYHKFIEYYNDSFDYSDDNNNTQNNFYKNLRTDNIYSNCSQISNGIEIRENNNNSTIMYIQDKLINYKSNYYNDINQILNNYISLSSLLDISKLNYNNFTNLDRIFYNCLSLLSLPDISKWNINNVRNMSEIFYHCSSLLSLPDISKWNTNNFTNISKLFIDCLSLSSLPDISK